jgi:hypothetical protein
MVISKSALVADLYGISVFELFFEASKIEEFYLPQLTNKIVNE